MFQSTGEIIDGVAKITLKGELDAAASGQFKDTIEKMAEQNPKKVVMFMEELDFMASSGLRVLIFAKQKMGAGVDIHLIGCQEPVLNSLEMSGFHHSVYLQETYSEV
ncbi:MAG TPA: anti-anti-sigma factor [Cyanobacteria bacterium UBA8530]|nr:anti-anti-sigma factor [Cyanobacteria bacterium UBA8530]